MGILKNLNQQKTIFQRGFKGVEWAIENYYPCKANYKYFDKSKLCDDDGNEIIGRIRSFIRGRRYISVRRTLS